MNEHKNIITIEDEIKEFSDKPVKSSALFKALEEKGVPDSSEASAGDVLSLGEDKKPTWSEPSGGLPDPSEASVGDVLTKGEDGIGWSAPSGGGLVVHATSEALDKTWQEIYDAFSAGRNVVIVTSSGGAFPCIAVYANSSTDHLVWYDDKQESSPYTYWAENSNDYPILD